MRFALMLESVLHFRKIRKIDLNFDFIDKSCCRPTEINLETEKITTDADTGFVYCLRIWRCPCANWYCNSCT